MNQLHCMPLKILLLTSKNVNQVQVNFGLIVWKLHTFLCRNHFQTLGNQSHFRVDSETGQRESTELTEQLFPWREVLTSSNGCKCILNIHCCSVALLCLTLCNPMDCSMPAFPVLHYLLELSQTHVH